MQTMACLGEPAAYVPGVVAVEHDELPFAHFVRAANPKGFALEFAAHGVRFIVIAGNAEHGFAQFAEDAAKAQIAGGIVLHQIAGDQHGRIVGNACKRIIEHRVQTRIGFYSAQPAGGAAIEMWVGDL